jgi:hypothetical protein
LWSPNFWALPNQPKQRSTWLMAMQRATLRSSPKLRAPCCCWKWSPAVSQTNGDQPSGEAASRTEAARLTAALVDQAGTTVRPCKQEILDIDDTFCAAHGGNVPRRGHRRGGIRCSAPCHGIGCNPQTLRSRPVRCCFKLLAFPPNKVPEGIAHQPLQAYSPHFAVAGACAGSIPAPESGPRQEIRTYINNYRKNKPAVAKLRKRQRQRALSLRYERRSVSVGKGPIGNSDLMADAPSDTKENPCWLGQ